MNIKIIALNVVNTMKEVGVEIKFPVEEYAYRVVFIAKVFEEVLEEYGFQVHEETNKRKEGVKTLIKK